MNLSSETKLNIHNAHFVRGIDPEKYLVKYLNIFELIEYRAHLQPDDIYIVFYPDDVNPPNIMAGKAEQLTYSEFAAKVFNEADLN